MSNDPKTGTASKHVYTAPSGDGGRGGRWRRWFTWRRIIVVGVLLVAATVGVRRIIPVNVDDGFIAFEPSLSLFPAAPVADAETVVGIGQPDQWFEGPDFCPWGRLASTFAKDWHTVRHDWEDDGEDRSWIISERTIGFDDVGEFDDFVNGFRDRVKYCGWEYGHSWTGSYNGILTQLDGLPEDAFAFTVDASPESIDDPEFGESNPDDFHALGAVLPGHKKGQLMYVMWIGWGVDVPADEFVATANRLYDAAHDAQKPSYDGDDATIDFRMGELDLDAAGVSPLLGDDLEFGLPGLTINLCNRIFTYDDLSTVTETADEDEAGGENDSRSVVFLTWRWRERSDYLAAKDEISRIVAPLCIGTVQERSFLIEPIAAAGLPEGTQASLWRDFDAIDSRESYAAVVSDDERQLSMVIVWREFSGPVPSERFVEAVNKAWTWYLAQNP